MARCVLAAAEPLADGPGRNAERRIERIEQARFADAGVAGEGTGLPAQCIAQLVDAEPRRRARAQDTKADGAVNSIEMIRRVKVALIEADDRLAVGIFRDGDHAVDQKRIGDGVDVRRDHDELVNIRHCRADERIAPRQDGVDAALAVRIEADLHTVADQRTAPVVPETAAGLALHDLIAGGHIVKAAEGFLNPSLCHRINQSSAHRIASDPARRQSRPSPFSGPCRKEWCSRLRPPRRQSRCTGDSARRPHRSPP